MINELSVMCFLSVAKHMSFTRAAEEGFMSRQAVSNNILSLEKRLGVKLFNRTTNVIELTVEGKLYLEFFQNVIRDFEALADTVGKVRKPKTYLLVGHELGVIIDNATIEFMLAYMRGNEDVDIKICRYDPQLIESKLISGQLDMALTTIPKHSKIYKNNFSYIILRHVEYVLVTSKNHPKAKCGASYTDFNGEQAVYWNMGYAVNDEFLCRRNFMASFADIGITVNPSIQCTSMSSAYDTLLLGEAVMLCGTDNEFCKLPGLITYPLPKQEAFGCVWNVNAPAATMEFIEAFRKQVGL